MLHVFEIADRIHIQRLGRRTTVITPQSHSMSGAHPEYSGVTVALRQLLSNAATGAG